MLAEDPVAVAYIVVLSVSNAVTSVNYFIGTIPVGLNAGVLLDLQK